MKWGKHITTVEKLEDTLEELDEGYKSFKLKHILVINVDQIVVVFTFKRKK
jgi:hypothetical protein